MSTIKILALTAGGGAAPGSRNLFHPGEAQPGALPKAARNGGACGSLWWPTGAANSTAGITNGMVWPPGG